MNISIQIKRNVLLLPALFAVATLYGQVKQTGKEYVPQVGQKGKDVVWVPTPQELVDKMLALASVKSGDFVIDLGSGDGRTVISAAKLGARAEGVEFNHDMVILSRENAKREGVSGSVKFIEEDLFNADLSKATVITLFLLPQLNLKLRPLLLDLKPGTRVVSNTFTMGEWLPDSSVTTPENWNSWNTAFLWVVPAKVSGQWKTGKSQIDLTQEFQTASGTWSSGDKSFPVIEGRLRGDHISFIINEEKYSAVVDGDEMRGTVTNTKDGIRKDFEAKRITSQP
jgi:SAM-dependent methyltransferase